MRAGLLTLAMLVVPAGVARADAMPACEEGQHLETNPVEPGAMHHGGGRCVDDPGRGCSVARGAGGGAGAGTLLIAALAAAITIRRGRRGARSPAESLRPTGAPS
jgi:hypothetical protein